MESVLFQSLGHHTVLIGADCLHGSVSLSRHVKCYLNCDVGSQKCDVVSRKTQDLEMCRNIEVLKKDICFNT